MKERGAVKSPLSNINLFALRNITRRKTWWSVALLIAVIALNRRPGPDRVAEVAFQSRRRGRLQITMRWSPPHQPGRGSLQIASPWSPPNRDDVVAVLAHSIFLLSFSLIFSPSSYSLNAALSRRPRHFRTHTHNCQKTDERKARGKTDEIDPSPIYSIQFH